MIRFMKLQRCLFRKRSQAAYLGVILVVLALIGGYFWGAKPEMAFGLALGFCLMLLLSVLSGIYSLERLGGIVFGLDVYAALLTTAVVVGSRSFFSTALVGAAFYVALRALILILLAVWLFANAARRERAGWFTCLRLVLVSVLCLFVADRMVFVERVVNRAFAMRAASEIKGADLALTKLLSDGEVSLLTQLFTHPEALIGTSAEETIRLQSQVALELLRHGRDTSGLKPEKAKRLGPVYMNLGNDPWGHPYRFYFGPLQGPVNAYIFRSYRGPDHVYDMKTYARESEQTRGLPEPEADSSFALGYPCSPDLPVYIFSCGKNGRPNQLPWGGNGGDDINNWDNASGWERDYS